MIWQMFAFSVQAAESIKDIYADLYGLDVVYTSTLTETPSVTLIDGETEENVAHTAVVEDSILHLHFTTPIEKDKEYIFQAGDYKKSVVVKELFTENFNEEQESTVSNVNIDKTDWYSTAGQGTFIQNGSAFGGNNSNMLAVTNSAFYVKKAEVLQERDLTVSADVVLIQREDKGNPSGGICLRAKNNDWANAYRLRVYAARNDVAVYATGFSTVATTAKTHTDVRGKMKYDAATLNHTNITKGTEKPYVLRNYDNVSGGYYDGTYLGTLIDTNNHFGTTKQGVAFQSDANSVMLIDNISVTKCVVSDYIPPESGEVVATALTGNFDNLTMTFDRTLKGTKDFTKIKVYENGNLINAEVKLDANDEKNLVITPKSYLAENTYKVTVAQGFGTKTLTTYKDYEFEFYLEPGKITVTDEVMTVENITITMDKEEGWDNTPEKVKIYENGIEINADIKKVGNKVVIVPESFKADYKYKVVLEKGFGGKNTYLLEEHTFEETLIKETIEILDISGDNKSMSMKFSCDISTIKDFTSYVSVTKDDIKLPVKFEADGNILNIKLEKIENDKIYEISVEKFETKTGVFKKAVLKKVMLETQFFEDFEDDEFSAGIEAGGKTIEYGDGQKGRILWSANCYITKEEIIKSEDIVLSYDYKLYNANLNSSDKAYTSAVPYSLWGYNLQTKGYKDGYRIYMQPSQKRVQTIKNSTATYVSGEDTSYDKFKDGDIYYDSALDTYTFYVKGDKFPESIAEAKGVAESTREEPPVYKIEWVKKGGSMYITRDGTEIAKYEPENPEYKTGYLAITCQNTEMAIIDNVRASIFKVLENEEGEEITASSLILGEEVEKSISGTFKIKNYSGTDEDICAVVAAYGADNELISATVMDLGQLGAGGIKDIPFTINNVSGAKKVSLFLMDTLKDINQYGYYEFD